MGTLQELVVLLADDEPVVRDMVNLALTRAGFTVLIAADGAEALALSRSYEGTIHLLLTDVKMPHMTGIELAAAMVIERPGIAIMMMSGHSSGKIPVGFRTKLLRKPFLPKDLVTRIQNALRDTLDSVGP